MVDPSRWIDSPGKLDNGMVGESLVGKADDSREGCATGKERYCRM